MSFKMGPFSNLQHTHPGKDHRSRPPGGDSPYNSTVIYTIQFIHLLSTHSISVFFSITLVVYNFRDTNSSFRILKAMKVSICRVYPETKTLTRRGQPCQETETRESQVSVLVQTLLVEVTILTLNPYKPENK